MDTLEILIQQLDNYNNTILFSLNTIDLQQDRKECIERIDKQCKLLHKTLDDNEKELFNNLIKNYVIVQENYKHKTNEFDRLHSLVVEPIEGKEMYNYVSQRHKDILRLERDIQEIHELFIATYALTIQQGEKIDSIANVVKDAKENVNEANDDLIVAYKKKKRWYQF
jgi:t-SNARE complex subunit (syntaxin)